MEILNKYTSIPEFQKYFLAFETMDILNKYTSIAEFQKIFPDISNNGDSK